MLCQLSSLLRRPFKLNVLHNTLMNCGTPKTNSWGPGFSKKCVLENANIRWYSSPRDVPGSQRNKSTVYYVIALGVLVGGFSYAAVPLYRLFCQVKF